MSPRSVAQLEVLHGGAGYLLTVHQVAEQLRLSTATVYKLCEQGELAHVRVLNAIRVHPRDLAAYLAERRRGGR